MKKAKTLRGNGSAAIDKTVLMAKAKKKLIAQELALKFLDIAREKGEFTPAMKKRFWNVWHCHGKIDSANGRTYGKYCKNRICPICCGNRRAELMRRYLPVLKNWAKEGDPYLVTLTVKSPSAMKLKFMIEKGVLKAFKIITARYRKRNSRNKGMKLVGMKSLECNFNQHTKTYNPHLHLIVPNKEIAQILISEWMEIWNRRKDKIITQFVVRWAQDMRPIKKPEKDLIELIKYGTKIFTPEDAKKAKRREKTPFRIYARALYNIQRALEGHKIFETFGFTPPKTDKVKGGKSTEVTKYEELKYDHFQHDWIENVSLKELTGFRPDAELIFQLENLDTEIE
jgi:hypothetical protein